MLGGVGQALNQLIHRRLLDFQVGLGQQALPGLAARALIPARDLARGDLQQNPERPQFIALQHGLLIIHMVGNGLGQQCQLNPRAVGPESIDHRNIRQRPARRPGLDRLQCTDRAIGGWQLGHPGGPGRAMGNALGPLGRIGIVAGNHLIGQEAQRIAKTKGMAQAIIGYRTKDPVEFMGQQARLGPAEFIDGLVRIANHHNLTAAAVQGIEQELLDRINILKLIDNNFRHMTAKLRSQRRRGLKAARRFID